MRTSTTGTLALAGARLYHEVRGTGPPLLIIPTGNGDAAPFEAMADALADRYTVITYDRRGFSRSPLDGPVEDGLRLATDAHDARRLLRHLDAAPAYVFASCSGGIVGLALLERYPELVRRIVVHEPPLSSVLPDAADWLRFHDDLYHTYRRCGIAAAKDAFKAGVGFGDTRPPPGAELPQPRLGEMLSRIRGNQAFWFEHEMRPYSNHRPDIAALRSVADRLVLAGSTAGRANFPYRAVAALADRIGAAVVHFPGAHVGHVTHPFEFADALDGALAHRGGPRAA